MYCVPVMFFFFRAYEALLTMSTQNGRKNQRKYLGLTKMEAKNSNKQANKHKRLVKGRL